MNVSFLGWKQLPTLKLLIGFIGLELFEWIDMKTANNYVNLTDVTAVGKKVLFRILVKTPNPTAES